MKTDDLVIDRHVLSGSWRWGKPWVTISSWQSSTTSSSSLWNLQVRIVSIFYHYWWNIINPSFCFLTSRFQTSRRESSRWLIGITSRETRTTQINTTTWLRIILPTIVEKGLLTWPDQKQKKVTLIRIQTTLWCDVPKNETGEEGREQGEGALIMMVFGGANISQGPSNDNVIPMHYLFPAGGKTFIWKTFFWLSEGRKWNVIVVLETM